MRELIELYAHLVWVASLAVMFISWTVKAVALNNAIETAILSPLAVFFTLFFVFVIATHMGWMK